MTQYIYMVSRSQPQVGARIVDAVLVVLVNADSSANALINAALAANQAKQVLVTSQNSDYTSDMETLYTSNGYSDEYPANYFDTAQELSVQSGSPSGGLNANGDAYVTYEGVRGAPVLVPGSSYTPVS